MENTRLTDQDGSPVSTRDSLWEGCYYATSSAYRIRPHENQLGSGRHESSFEFPDQIDVGDSYGCPISSASRPVPCSPPRLSNCCPMPSASRCAIEPDDRALRSGHFYVLGLNGGPVRRPTLPFGGASIAPDGWAALGHYPLGVNMMMAMPSTAIAEPVRSHAVGRTPSISQSHKMAVAT